MVVPKPGLQRDMARRVDEVLLTTQHMRHPHHRVVHSDREVVSREPIAFADDEVVKLVGFDGDFAEDLIFDGDGFIGHDEADDMGFARL